MSSADQDSARLRDAFASMAQAAEATPDCLDPERIWQAARCELPPAEIRDLIDHTAICPYCAEDWRLARELVSRAEPSVADFPPHRSSAGSRWWLVAAAAVLLVAVGAPLWRTLGPIDAPETVRAPASMALIRSLVPADAILRRSDCVLRWSHEGPTPVSAYTLVVSTASFDVLVKVEDLEGDAYRVPPEALDPVPPGGKIFWRVEAIGPADRRLASPTFVHRVE